MGSGAPKVKAYAFGYGACAWLACCREGLRLLIRKSIELWL